MTIGIYGFFDKETEECLYVGLSKNIEERFKQHLKLLRGKRHNEDFIQWWINNNETPSAFEFKILEVCEKHLLNKKEIYWFNELKPKFYGKSPSENEKWKHSVETKAKISESSQKQRLGKIRSEGLICKNCKTRFYPTKNRKRTFCAVSCRRENENRRFDKIALQSKYESGMSLKDIAKEYDCSYRTIHQFMVRNGIPRRSWKDS